MLRLIAGRARGRRLAVPAERATRPMSGVARTALFNVLAAELPGARVLDLYAGSGALGLEALSRGAAECVFVERSRQAAAVLRENLAGSGLAGGEVLEAPAELALADLAARGRAFDVVFSDPPFAAARSAAGLAGLEAELAAAGGLLAPGGRLVLRLESRGPGAEPAPPAGLEAAGSRRYGRSRLVFLRRPAGGGTERR